MMVIPNKSSARYISELICKSEASGNCSAILLANVLAGKSSEADARSALPITIVIAIVSPIARANPKMMAPIIPERA